MRPSRLERFFRLPRADRSLLVRSVLVLAAARVSLWLLPLRTARRVLARATRRPALRSVPPERIGWAVSVAQRMVPRATCLPQALAAEALLMQGGHPAEVRIGVLKSEQGRLEAHAWVESGGSIVVGELPHGLSSYAPMPPLPDPRS